jgi:hypothetical protein
MTSPYTHLCLNQPVLILVQPVFIMADSLSPSQAKLMLLAIIAAVKMLCNDYLNALRNISPANAETALPSLALQRSRIPPSAPLLFLHRRIPADDEIRIYDRLALSAAPDDFVTAKGYVGQDMRRPYCDCDIVQRLEYGGISSN